MSTQVLESELKGHSVVAVDDWYVASGELLVREKELTRRHDDIAFAAVSRAPLNRFTDFKRRVGWTFRWLSSDGTSFNYDFGVSFRREDLDGGDVYYNFKMQKLRSEDQPGLSSFYKNDNGEIFRTYSTYERGLDLLMGAHNFRDLMALGRNTENRINNWVEIHDPHEVA